VLGWLASPLSRVARYFWIDPRYKSRISIASMTDKSSINPQSLHAMRHSYAHLMATAIHQLWPQAKFGVGPAIDKLLRRGSRRGAGESHSNRAAAAIAGVSLGTVKRIAASSYLFNDERVAA
jgi:hypothetical protein